MQHQPPTSQKRVHVSLKDQEDKRIAAVYAKDKSTTMGRGERHKPSFDGQSPKKLKSDSGSFEQRSVAVPSVLTSMFSPEGESSSSQYDQYNPHQHPHHYPQHHESHQPQHFYHQQQQQHQQHHEHHQPQRSVEEYYSPPIQPSSSQSMSPHPPRRANTYPHFENHSGRGEGHHGTLTPPRRSRSHHWNYHPYPPHPPPRGSSRSAFEAYPHEQQQQQYFPPGGGRGISPRAPPHPPPIEDPQYHHKRTTPAPISYVCESARTCYPNTDLGKKVRDQVRSMTEGTRLVPVARAIHHHEEKPRGMVPENPSDPKFREFPHHQPHNSNDWHHRDHPHSHHYPHHQHHRANKTIRLLDSTKEILDIHSVLGRGSFSRVTAVTIKEPKSKDRDAQKLPDAPHSHHLRRPRYFACKSIKEEILVSNVARMGKRNRDQSETYRQSVEFCVLAASQLAYEAHILSCLDHPNIVRMRGLDADGILGFEKRDHRGFFLLMDVLSETLDQKINKWRKEKLLSTPRHQGHHRHNYPISNDNPEALLLRRHQEKLAISLQLASALEYLHDRRVVYRDLKPSNVGFIAENGWTPETATNPPPSATTRVQLFDFGLSRELTPNQPTLRGAIGTMRYMAPEVCLDACYDCDCDIYSYSILCWELWTQKVPFEEVATPDLYREQVCQRGYRPVYRPEEDPLYRRYSPEEQEYHHTHPQHRPVQRVPNEILLLLTQAWKHEPNARIRWPKIQHQLALIETLVSLQLEERELSTTAAVNRAQGQAPHERNTRPAPFLDIRGGHPELLSSREQADFEASRNRFAQNHYPHSSRSSQHRNDNNDWGEPIRVDHADSFSLREEDFDVDLGI